MKMSRVKVLRQINSETDFFTVDEAAAELQIKPTAIGS